MYRPDPIRKLKADFHVHTAEDPCDHVRYSAYRLIDIAAEKGFDVLSITNHNTLTFGRNLESYAGRKGILLMPGTEIMVSNAHVLVINPAFKTIRYRYNLDELPQLKDDRSLFVAPHPFFFLSRSLRSRLFPWLAYFDALEFSSCYNSLINRNKRVLYTAVLYNKPVIANSDAHDLWQFGKTYSLIAAKKDVASIIKAVKEGRVEIQTTPFSLAQLGWLFMKSLTFDKIWHILKL